MLRTKHRRQTPSCSAKALNTLSSCPVLSSYDQRTYPYFRISSRCFSLALGASLPLSWGSRGLSIVLDINQCRSGVQVWSGRAVIWDTAASDRSSWSNGTHGNKQTELGRADQRDGVQFEVGDSLIFFQLGPSARLVARERGGAATGGVWPPKRKSGNLGKTHHSLVSSLSRSGDLTNLSALLNGLVLATEDTSELLDHWLTAPPVSPLRPSLSSATLVNCADPRYADVFTGQPLKANSHSMIVDFVPFGFDLDMLEVRLVENYDVVDAFVIYESMRTHHGDLKKAYFNQTRHSGRWDAFESKLIHFVGTGDDLDELRRTVPRKLARCSCFYERSMRIMPVRMFNQSDLPLVQTLRQAAATGRPLLALQNDADELVSARLLSHLRQCQIQTGKIPAYAPCTSYWMSFEWLRRTCPAPQSRGWGIECVSAISAN